MKQKATRPLTKEEYDKVFSAYKAYLEVLQNLSDNENIHKDQRDKLDDAARNPLVLNKLYYHQA